MVFLTPNDWALVVDKAIRRDFQPGESIIQRGKNCDGIFVLIKGTASVQVPAQVPPLTIGPGEVCGEISFLDEQPATVNVIAKDAVEAYYLDSATLQTLFELFPHLGSRFYHSLASTLSRRLRKLIGDPASKDLAQKQAQGQ